MQPKGLTEYELKPKRLSNHQRMKEREYDRSLAAAEPDLILLPTRSRRRRHHTTKKKLTEEAQSEKETVPVQDPQNSQTGSDNHN
jgi:hypothetical protein